MTSSPSLPRRALARTSVLLLGLAAACGAGEPADRPARMTYLLPTIFEPNCATSGCHSVSAPAADLVLEGSALTVQESLVRKGLVYPGQPEGSPLLNFLRGIDVVVRMPPDAPLPEGDILFIETWIVEGARP